MIHVQDLVYEYPGLRALDGVSFDVAPGTITALVGPNGAGKTTLLRCLAGMDRPLAGRIEVDGIDVVEEPRRSHRVLGYLGDFFGLYDRLSVRRALTYVARANGLTAAAVPARVADIAARLGLDSRLDQAAGNLSRGLRQRLAIAQAIIHDPRVVLLDEPAAGLDPEARHGLGQLLRALAARGMTVLVSSHILAELESYSSHLMIVDRGRLVEHRALGAAGGAATPCLLEVQGNFETALAVLARQSAVSGVEAQPPTVRFLCAGSAGARAEVLRALVAAGVAISAYGPAPPDLEAAYLATLARQRTP